MTTDPLMEIIKSQNEQIHQLCEAQNKFLAEQRKQSDRQSELIKTLSDDLRSCTGALKMQNEQLSLLLKTQQDMLHDELKNYTENTENSLKTQIRELISHNESLADRLGNIVRKSSESFEKSSEKNMGDLEKVHLAFAESFEKRFSAFITEFRADSQLHREQLQYEHQKLETLLQKNANDTLADLESFGRKLTSDVAQSLLDGCEKFIERQNTANFEYYRKLLQLHVGTLTMAVEDSIGRFSELNHQAFADNAAQMKSLLNAGEDIVRRLGICNIELQQLLSENYRLFSEANAENISRLKDCIATMTDNIARKNSDHMTQLRDFQKNTADILAAQLEKYAADLVSQSAAAVAEVQRDNNIKLQSAADEVKALAEADRDFINFSSAAAEKTAAQISTLIANSEGFIGSLREVSSETVGNVDDVLGSRLGSLDETVRRLNTEQAAQFAAAMESYRDEFLKANAAALADVQQVTNETIANAYEKLGALSDVTADMKNSYDELTKLINDLSGNMNSFISETDMALAEHTEAIRSACTGSTASIEMSVGTFSEESQKILKKMGAEHEKYTQTVNSVNSMLEKIQAEIAGCQAQMADMNSLTAQDVKLLGKLIGAK